MIKSLIPLLLCATPLAAESLVAVRTLPAMTVIAPEDIMLVDAKIPNALTEASPAIGRETKIAIYAGRPIRAADLSSPTVVERNGVVPLIYSEGPLNIRTEGRALARGTAGETIRIMNLSSRTTVSGRIGPDGSVYVGGMP